MMIGSLLISYSPNDYDISLCYAYNYKYLIILVILANNLIVLRKFSFKKLMKSWKHYNDLFMRFHLIYILNVKNLTSPWSFNSGDSRILIFCINNLWSNHSIWKVKCNILLVWPNLLKCQSQNIINSPSFSI